MPDESNDEGSFLGKIALSAVVIVLAIPGLIIEPGPLSEIAALGVLAAIWVEGESPSDAAKEAAEGSL